MRLTQRGNHGRKQRRFQVQRRASRDGAQQLPRILDRQRVIARGEQDDAGGSANANFHFARSFSGAYVIAEKYLGAKFLRPGKGGKFSSVKLGEDLQAGRAEIARRDEVNEFQSETNARPVSFCFFKDDFRAKNCAHFRKEMEAAQLIQMNQRPGIKDADYHFTTLRVRCVVSRQGCQRLQAVPRIVRGSLSVIPSLHQTAEEGSHQPRRAGYTMNEAFQAVPPATGQSPAAGVPAVVRGVPEYPVSARSWREDTHRPHTFQPQFFPA